MKTHANKTLSCMLQRHATKSTTAQCAPRPLLDSSSGRFPAHHVYTYSYNHKELLQLLIACYGLSASLIGTTADSKISKWTVRSASVILDENQSQGCQVGSIRHRLRGEVACSTSSCAPFCALTSWPCSVTCSQECSCKHSKDARVLLLEGMLTLHQ